MTTTKVESPTPSDGKPDHTHSYLIRLLAIAPEGEVVATDTQLNLIAETLLSAIDGRTYDDATARVATAMVDRLRNGDDQLFPEPEIYADGKPTAAKKAVAKVASPRHTTTEPEAVGNRGADRTFKMLTDPAINFGEKVTNEARQLVAILEGVDAILDRATLAHVGSDKNGVRIHADDLEAVGITLQSVRRMLEELEADAVNLRCSLVTDVMKAG